MKRVMITICLLLMTITAHSYVHNVRTTIDYKEYGVNAKPLVDTIRYYEIRGDTTSLIKTIEVLQAQIDDDFQFDSVAVCTSASPDIRISHFVITSDLTDSLYFGDYWQMTGDCAGEGPLTHTQVFFAIDTTQNPDDTSSLPVVYVGMKFGVDSSDVGKQYSVGGEVTWNVLASQSYYFNFFKPGYSFTEKLDTMGTANSVDSIYGINLLSSNLGVVYAYAYDLQGNPVKDAHFMAQVNAMSGYLRDTCDAWFPVVRKAENKSDVNGYVSLVITKQKCLVGATDYTFLLREKKGGRVIASGVGAMPDTSQVDLYDIIIQ